MKIKKPAAIIIILLVAAVSVYAANKIYFVENKNCNKYSTCDVYGNNFISNGELWEDLRFPSNILAIHGAANTPEYENIQDNLYLLAFDPNTMEQVFGNAQLPHSRKDNSDLKFHFHYTTDTMDLANIVWCAEYSCANIHYQFPSSTTKCISHGPDPTTNNHEMTGMITVKNNLTESSMCIFRIFRNATDSRDTFQYDAYLLEFDIHYQVEKMGEDI